MHIYKVFALAALGFTALSGTAFAGGTTLDACESIGGKEFVLEMNGTSGTAVAEKQSSIVGRLALAFNGATGSASTFINNWNGGTGYATYKVACKPLGDRRGRFTFGVGRGVWSADFVYKTGYDQLVLMRSDAKQAIVGDAIESPKLPGLGANLCKIVTGFYAGTIDGWTPKVDSATMMQFDIGTAGGKFSHFSETEASAQITRSGTTQCLNINANSIRVRFFYSNGGAREVVMFPGGPNNTYLPSVDFQKTLHESGWMYHQPDPIEIPG